jgi:hypothetical protein
MKIYRVLDTYNGEFKWCSKKDLTETINLVEASMRSDKMAELKGPHTDPAVLTDHVSDYLEVSEFDQKQLVEILNASSNI